VTVYVPEVLGAVYKPELDTLPPVALQVTLMFVLPVTVAVNCCVEFGRREDDVGLIATVTAAGLAETVIEATADCELSATLVAVSVYVPAELGAV
jgi:hypothetical protein